MTIPLVPPLPDPQVMEFDEKSMVPVWREFWVKLLVSVNASIVAATTLATTVSGLSKLVLAPCTVALLPAAATNQGTRGMATDATVTLAAGIGTIVAGTGTNPVPVISDGTNWLIG